MVQTQPFHYQDPHLHGPMPKTVPTSTKKKKSINMQRKVIHPHASYVSDVQGTRTFGNHKGIQMAKFLKNIFNHIKH